MEFPTVTLYATLLPDKALSVYIGGKVGFAGLQALQAQDPVTTGSPMSYSGTASTMAFGPAVGLTLDLGDLGLFIEWGYTRRCFPSVSWAAVNSNTVPDVLPKELSLSGHTFSFGAQVEFAP